MRTALLVTLLCLAAVGGGCGSAKGGSAGNSAGDSAEVESGIREGRAKPISIRVDGQVLERAEPEPKLPSGPPPRDLVVENLIRGVGPRSESGDRLTLEYVGIHYDGSYFTNSWERSSPFFFELGSRSFGRGWDKGLAGMRVGERRELIVPPRYLDWGNAPPSSDPDETIVYVVDLLRID